MRVVKANISKFARAAVAAPAFALCLSLLAPTAPRAQRRADSGVNVTGVSARTTERGAVVTVTGDGPLTRAQTWQDEEGFHIVGYKWSGALKSGLPRGVKARRVGDSLELVVTAGQGGVTVNPRFNTLEIVVNGGLRESGGGERQQQSATDESSAARAAARQQQPAKGRAEASGAASFAAKSVQAGDAQGGRSKSAEQSAKSEEKKADSRAANQSAAQQTGASGQPSQPAAAQQTSVQQSSAAAQPGVAQPGGAQADAQQIAQAQAAQAADAASAAGAAAQPGATPALMRAGQSGGGSSLYLVPAVVFLVALAGAFLFARSRRQTDADGNAAESNGDAAKSNKAEAKSNKAESKWKLGGSKNGGAKQDAKGVAAKAGGAKSGAQAAKAAKSNGAGGKAEGAEKSGASQALARRERPAVVSFSQAAPSVLFGALRVEQEVEKLVAGQTHTIDVLASRAQDDRRAVETSLLKAINSQQLSEAERARARRALEEYGFVARQSAALLLAPNAFERSSAARALGQIKSESSLPFLLEALYDAEPVVRTEAVTSLGSLGLPSAIGALLDAARRHPEIPAHLLGRALSACSVDSIDLAPAPGGGFGLPEDFFNGEINSLEPTGEVEQLPEWLEDETLADSLAVLALDDVEARVAAAQQLSQFRVRRSVEALAAMAASDTDASVRAAAVTSLGLVGHESVFAPVLIAMADEAREVRAAAARALSRLNFDRADAYARVIESADAETLRRLAAACVNAGLARQALDRLASDDRRQAYEAFSLLSLVARGGETAMILEVVEGHSDLNVRLSAARMLALQGQPETTARLRDIAWDARTPEPLRAAIKEITSRGDQPDGAIAAEARAVESAGEGREATAEERVEAGAGEQRYATADECREATANEGDKSVRPIA